MGKRGPDSLRFFYPVKARDQSLTKKTIKNRPPQNLEAACWKPNYEEKNYLSGLFAAFWFCFLPQKGSE